MCIFAVPSHTRRMLLVGCLPRTLSGLSDGCSEISPTSWPILHSMKCFIFQWTEKNPKQNMPWKLKKSPFLASINKVILGHGHTCRFICGHFWTRTEGRDVDRLCVMLSLHCAVAQSTVSGRQAVTAPWFSSHTLTSDVLLHCFVTNVSVPSYWYFKIPRPGKWIRNRNWFLTVGLGVQSQEAGRYCVCGDSSLWRQPLTAVGGKDLPASIHPFCEDSEEHCEKTHLFGRSFSINFERDTNIQTKAHCVHIVLKQESWTLALHAGGPAGHSVCMDWG